MKNSHLEPARKAAIFNGITLNNIPEVTAGRMRQHFLSLRGNYSIHKRKSFWVSKDMLSEMVSLLNEELKKDIASKDPSEPDTLIDLTDGIRIYIGANLSSTGPQFDLQLLFVSTKDKGPDPTNPKSGRKHKDNYLHDTSHKLFSLKQYEQSCYEGSCKGTELYNQSGNPDICTVRPPHGIERAEAEAMVAYFAEPHIIITEAEWFDLGLWEAFNSIPSISGVRLYLARHTGKYGPPMMDAFIITSTVFNGTDHIDDFTCYDEIFEIYQRAYQDKYGHRITPPQDNGELCPTHCD